LEVAVGTGTECAKLATSGAFDICAGADLSAHMLKRARRRGASLLLCRADARALPFRSGSFDDILNSYMIDLLAEDEIPAALSEFKRVLRSGGRLVLVTMGRQRPLLQRIWMMLYRCSPLLVGGCRPVDAAKWLEDTGWQIERCEQVSQMGFRSELLVVRASGPMLHGAE
jgi:ubiquinone/menaquinone biosynthesis C-methylase UbiE